MKTMTENSTFNYNTPCVFIQGPEDSDDEASIISKGNAANNDRIILTYPLLVDFNGKITTGGETAAALA
jgi:hypothetical protein